MEFQPRIPKTDSQMDKLEDKSFDLIKQHNKLDPRTADMILVAQSEGIISIHQNQG
jgi:hypothetical protein